MENGNSTSSLEEPTLLNLSAEEFLAYWKMEKEPSSSTNIKVYDDVNKGKEIHFINVSINENILVEENNEKLFPLKLRGSKLKDLRFEKAKIGDVRIMNSSLKTITLNNTMADFFSIQDKSTADNIEISQDSTIAQFSLTTINVEELYISNSNFEVLWLLGVKCTDIEFDSSEIKNFWFRNSSIVENILIGNSSITEFWFGEKSIASNVLFNRGTIIQDFNLISNSKICGLESTNTTFKNIVIENVDLIEKFHFRFNELPFQLAIKNSNLFHLNLEDTVINADSTLIISNTKFSQISFVNTSNYGGVFLSNIQSLENSLLYKKDKHGEPLFLNYIHQFENVNSPSTLKILDSDLGKLQIINSDFNSFDKFEFMNSKMLEVFVAGSSLPDEEQFQILDGCAAGQYQQKRLAFSQFKKIYENQGDRASSLEYLALEMEAYRKQLQSESIWKNLGELFILWANRISTFYGTRWWQGALMTFFIMAICFTVFCRFQGYVLGDGSPEAIKEMKRLISYSFYYLNPLRDNDSIAFFKDKDMTSYARIWDFWSRVFVAYFVYQTIQAFRKLGKSSG